jgi:hypothetical protein
VLKPGGRGLIIELRHDASPESINRHMDGMGLSAVNRLLTKLAFRTGLRDFNDEIRTTNH